MLTNCEISTQPRRFLRMHGADWLSLLLLPPAFVLFMWSSSHVRLFEGGCHTELESVPFLGWLQPFQPFFSVALVVIPHIIAKKVDRKCAPKASNPIV